MKFRSLILFSASIIFIGCENKKNDLNSIKKEFLNKILLSEIEESPFNMHYSMKTVFFSKDLVSLFGEINVYDCMPHGWKCYEGKTYIKINGEFREIALEDLFTSNKQKEFLRSYCENCLKRDSMTYFGGDNPLKEKLASEDIQTFVIDEHSLSIIFQPYVAVSSADSPCIIKIPLEDLKEHWDSGNILFPFLQEFSK